MQAIKNALTGHGSSHHKHGHHGSHEHYPSREATTMDTTTAATAQGAVIPEGVTSATSVAAATPVASATPVAAGTSVAAAEVNVPAQLSAQVVETDATKVETIVKPEVVHETAHQVEEEIVKPVVERDREQTEIHQVVQPVLDRQVNATNYVEQVDVAENRVFKEDMSAEDRALYERNAAFTNESTNLGTEHSTIVQPTEVRERIHNRVIEEVQPVIEREVINPTVISRVKPVYEKVVHAPVITSQVRVPVVASEVGLKGNSIDQARLTMTTGTDITGNTLVTEKATGLAGAAPAANVAREE